MLCSNGMKITPLFNIFLRNALNFDNINIQFSPGSQNFETVVFGKIVIFTKQQASVDCASHFPGDFISLMPDGVLGRRWIHLQRKGQKMKADICSFKSGLVIILSGLILTCQTAAGNVIYVDDDNITGPWDGSAAHPFQHIQTAINAAVSNVDQIEVAPGTYYESINFNGKAVWLYSSVGPEVTNINGTGHYHVVQCISGENANTILEGFTITGGNANGTGDPNNLGGGMYNRSSSPKLTNCTFSNNSAVTRGGGMYNKQGSNPIMTNCTFSGNSAEILGGGMG